jgi:hypothetical protein
MNNRIKRLIAEAKESRHQVGIALGLNRYELRDDHAVIFLNRKNGDRLECLIDQEDIDRVCGFAGKWYATWREEAQTFYVASRGVLLHRFLTNAPVGYEVDHTEHNGLDNRKGKLLVCTPAQNSRNRRLRTKAKCSSSSPHKGVYLRASTGCYRAQVSINGKRFEIQKTFYSAEQAAEAIASFEASAELILASFWTPEHKHIKHRIAAHLPGEVVTQ